MRFKVALPKIKINFPKIKKVSLKKNQLIPIFIVVGLVVIAIGGRKSPFGKNWEKLMPKDLEKTTTNTDGSIPDDNKYTAFFFDIYELISKNYWNVLTDEQIGTLVKLAVEKLTGNPVTVIPTNREQLRALLIERMNTMQSDADKKTFIVNLSDIVLANLEPFGRSRLYTSKKQKELSNTVKNITPEVNHYEVLGVQKDTPKEQIKIAYDAKLAELKKQEQTPEVKQNIEKLAKSYEVLKDTGNKNLYDQAGINPTIDNRLITPNIFYTHITKFSPTTVEELQRVMDKVNTDSDQPSQLIVDLRGNIGGAIDGLPYFLGPFIGANQYAYQFFSRGQKEDFITKTGWMPSMVRYKQVVVLIDGQTQSSAEVFAAVLKRYNVGVVVGEHSKGWGTVESVFKIKNQVDPENEEYSVFLVHELTLRDDNLTIEGKGVEPTVDIKNPNWDKDLYKHFNNYELVNAVKGLINNPK